MKIKVYSYWQENGEWKQGYRDTDLWLHIHGSWHCRKQAYLLKLKSFLRRLNLID